MPREKPLHDYPPDFQSELIEWRREYRDSLLTSLHGRLETYVAELDRTDPAHQARLSKRKDAVWDLIREAAKEWNQRGAPPDEFEIDFIEERIERRCLEEGRAKDAGPGETDTGNVAALRPFKA